MLYFTRWKAPGDHSTAGWFAWPLPSVPNFFSPKATVQGLAGMAQLRWCSGLDLQRPASYLLLGKVDFQHNGQEGRSSTRYSSDVPAHSADAKIGLYRACQPSRQRRGSVKEHEFLQNALVKFCANWSQPLGFCWLPSGQPHPLWRSLTPAASLIRDHRFRQAAINRTRTPDHRTILFQTVEPARVKPSAPLTRSIGKAHRSHSVQVFPGFCKDPSL